MKLSCGYDPSHFENLRVIFNRNFGAALGCVYVCCGGGGGGGGGEGVWGGGEEVNLSLACHSQMLMARRLRTSIAVTEDMLKPPLYDPKEDLPKQKERQRKQKLQHDKTAGALSPGNLAFLCT